MHWARRELLGAIGALPLIAAARDAEAGGAGSFQALKREAAALAARPWQPPAPSADAARIDFDTAGRIRFRRERTLWADRPGAAKVRLFAPSVTAPAPVSIEVEGRRLDDAPSYFERPADVAPPSGFAGFRAMNPTGESDWLAFQGASYFRAAGAQDQYGLSARAVAIDPGIDGREEFPAFTRFSLAQGPAGTLIVEALLDGESVTGAFRFVCRIGAGGVSQEVDAFLCLRRDVERLGLAPATSMFWYGEGDRRGATDWRPEIHDSDGLAIATGRGERLWRPLANPPRPILESFADEDPGGFGLLQRDRAFDHYQDDGAFYDRRPSLWVRPRGGWGKGAVSLYAFPTRSETVDNIVSFWTPAAAARAGRRYDYGYRLDWGSGEAPSPVARVVDVWTGAGGPPGAPPSAGVTKLVADFAGPALAGLGRASGVTAQLRVTHGRIVASHAYPVAGATERFRLAVDIAVAAGDEPCDLHAALHHGGRAVTETLLGQMFA